MTDLLLLNTYMMRAGTRRADAGECWGAGSRARALVRELCGAFSFSVCVVAHGARLDRCALPGCYKRRREWCGCAAPATLRGSKHFCSLLIHFFPLSPPTPIPHTQYHTRTHILSPTGGRQQGVWRVAAGPGPVLLPPGGADAGTGRPLAGTKQCMAGDCLIGSLDVWIER